MKTKKQYVNGNIMCLFPDSKIFQGKGTKEQFQLIQDNSTYDDVVNIFVELTPKQKEEKNFNKYLLNMIETCPEFEIKDSLVYLNSIKISLPKEVLSRFTTMYEAGEYNTQEWQSLCNFWYWMALNPNSEARESFYTFLEKYNVKLDKSGFILSYRWVKEKSGKNRELVEFISNSYIKVKGQKKSPKNYWITEDKNVGFLLANYNPVGRDVYSIIHGNLYNLYIDLPSLQENTFTDGHTGTFDIRIGQEVIMDRKETDESSASCSSGLTCSPSIE